MTELTRRLILASGAAVAAAPLIPAGARAGGGGSGGSPTNDATGGQVPSIYRYKVGDFVLTAACDGMGKRPLDGFISNADKADVEAVMKEFFLPPDALPISYTPLHIQAGDRSVLIDTGTGGRSAGTSGFLLDNLKAAGVDPETIDTVLISHFHGDHIGGIDSKDGKPNFPKARILVPEKEWAFWTDPAEMERAAEGRKGNFALVHKLFDHRKDELERFAWDSEVVPGITAIGAPGHTPGHTIFHIESGGSKLVFLADTTNHPALFATRPDWHAVFDMDPDMAEETRRKVFDMVAQERVRVHGFHFPFPANGHLAKQDKGYRFQPINWEVVL